MKCETCNYIKDYKTPKVVLDHKQIQNPGKMKVCTHESVGGIVGNNFCCNNSKDHGDHYETKKH